MTIQRMADWRQQLREHSPTLTVNSYKFEFELFQGADRAPAERREEERDKVARFVGTIGILPFDSACARIAARLNAELLNQGTPFIVTDVMIAATGLRHRWAVVTNNAKDFRRIDGFVIEDWR